MEIMKKSLREEGRGGQNCIDDGHSATSNLRENSKKPYFCWIPTALRFAWRIQLLFFSNTCRLGLALLGETLSNSFTLVVIHGM